MSGRQPTRYEDDQPRRSAGPRETRTAREPAREPREARPAREAIPPPREGPGRDIPSTRGGRDSGEGQEMRVDPRVEQRIDPSRMDARTDLRVGDPRVDPRIDPRTDPRFFARGDGRGEMRELHSDQRDVRPDLREARDPRDVRGYRGDSMVDPRESQFSMPRNAREPGDVYPGHDMEIDPPTAGRSNYYFQAGEGISREVIQADICRYLGADATCIPARNREVSERRPRYVSARRAHPR